MMVDPDRLRLLSQAMDAIADLTEGLAVADPATQSSSAAESGGPGTLISDVLGSGITVCEGVWSGFGSRCRHVAAAARGGASDFAVTDAEFSDALKAVEGVL